MRNFLIRALWAVMVVLVYGGLYFAFMWSLFNYPMLLIGVVAIGGIPIAYLAHRFISAEEQRRGVWSNLRDLTKGQLESVPDRNNDDQLIVSCQFGEVFFRVLSMNVNQFGIRLDRPLSAVKPLVIPWESVQRLDKIDLSSMPRFKDKETSTTCHILLTNSDKPLAIYPWRDEFTGFVPDRIGSAEYRPRVDL